MRVLLIANTLPPVDVSGVGEQVLQLAAALRQKGHEVEILGRPSWSPKVLFPGAVVPSTWRALRRFRPDVVQVHESDGALAALAVRRFRRRHRRAIALLALQQVSYVRERQAVRPLVDHAAKGRALGRPGSVERRFRWLKAPIQILFGRWTARWADAVLAPSAVTAGELEEDYGVSTVAVLPNVTGGLAIAEEAVDDRIGEAGDFLLFVGRLRLRKGVEVLLQALARLGAAESSAPGHALEGSFRLLVAGDGEHRGALEERCAELDLGATVTFLGRRSAAQVRGLLAACRGLVVPSIYEGMPLVILEAMEAARPVVASRVSGIPEVVVDGETGWVVPAEDSAALAAALTELLANPAEGIRRGAAGRRRLDERYRPRHAAEAWLAIVDRVAAPRD